MNKTEIKKQRILAYIKQQIELGVSPSVREIASALGIKSTSTVHKYLKELEEAGAIIRSQGLNRSVRLSSEPMVMVPLLGTVTAGQPILAIEEIEGYIPFSGYHLSGDDLFALRVQGDSMIDAGIFDGDIIIVRKTPVARNGEIVVALIEDEATVKRFYKENGHFRLQPENKQFDPIIVDEVVILGKVKALIREF